MHDAIIAFLSQHPEGVPSEELAIHFLKMQQPNTFIAHAAVSGILGRDQRCFYSKESLWQVKPNVSPSSRALSDLPWTAVYLLLSGEKPNQKVWYVALWNIFPEMKYQWGGWILNPDLLPFEERQMLCSPLDLPIDTGVGEKLIEKMVQDLHDRIPIFLTAAELGYAQGLAAKKMELLNDESVLISELFRAVRIPLSRPITLTTCKEALFATTVVPKSAYHQGELYAELVGELFNQIALHGIVGRDELEQAGMAQEPVKFAAESITYKKIRELPAVPGVYGFRSRAGTFIYIGKAKNIRRRLLSYFRAPEDSQKKVEQLRIEADSLMTHVCGSELESLLSEYRLIKKYAPALNRQVQINERSGSFQPIDDCIVLLPHGDHDLLMSFWIRKEEKTRMIPLSYTILLEKAEMCAKIETFFFSDKTVAESTDFAEQEIITRWVKRYRDVIPTIPVSRLASGADVVEALRVLWHELKG